MATFDNTVKGYLVFGLIIFSGIMFAISTQTNNDAAQPIIDNPILNRTYLDLNDSLNSLNSESQVQYTQFNNETPKEGFGSIVLFGVVSVGKTFSNAALGLFYAILRFPLKILGLPESLISIIIAWSIITIIVGLWLLYKLGG